MNVETQTTDPHAAPAGTARPGSRTRRGALLVIAPALVSVGVLGLWYAMSYLVLNPQRRFLAPPPHDVIRVAFLESSNLLELLDALWLSTRVSMIGLAAAIVIGMAGAIAMSQARWVERAAYPYVVVVQTIPILALVPLFGFWFGFGFFSRVLVCVLIAIPPIIFNTHFGLRSADLAHHDLFTLRGAGRLVRMWKLQLPSAMPAIFTGLRTSAGLSVVGAVVGDFFFRQGQPGIGILIDLYRSRLQSERMFGAIILAAGLGVVVFWFFGWLTKRAIGGWHESASAVSNE
jgi:NitT/TauT family transport system permease protein